MSTEPDAAANQGFVAEGTCATWRERYEADADRSMRDVAAAAGRPESTVRDHIAGRCGHADPQRGVHDTDLDAEGVRGPILDAIEDMHEANFGDTLYLSVRRVRSHSAFAAASDRFGIPGQKVGAVIEGLADGDGDRGFAAEQHNPDANVRRYAVTRPGGGDGV